ncbi:MAG: hypothetical protein GY772_11160 [bacterium]|nr:hypothetical protein [bacterium]
MSASSSRGGGRDGLGGLEREAVRAAREARGGRGGGPHGRGGTQLSSSAGAAEGAGMSTSSVRRGRDVGGGGGGELEDDGEAGEAAMSAPLPASSSSAPQSGWKAPSSSSCPPTSSLQDRCRSWRRSCSSACWSMVRTWGAADVAASGGSSSSSASAAGGGEVATVIRSTYRRSSATRPHVSSKVKLWEAMA